MIVAMPRDGAIILSDPIGKLDVLRVACASAGATAAMASPPAKTSYVGVIMDSIFWHLK